MVYGGDLESKLLFATFRFHTFADFEPQLPQLLFHLGGPGSEVPIRSIVVH